MDFLSDPSPAQLVISTVAGADDETLTVHEDSYEEHRNKQFVIAFESEPESRWLSLEGARDLHDWLGVMLKRRGAL